MTDNTQALLDRARELCARESGLAVVATSRADGSIQATVVNAGILNHPVSDEPVVGFVARGGAKKLSLLRTRPAATVVFRSGWEWVAVEGHADLAGPDDRLDGVESGDVLRLLRTIYAGVVGGAQQDWADLDREMTDERHTAVLIHPTRIYSNAGG
jgi:hypothetical protein